MRPRCFGISSPRIKTSRRGSPTFKIQPLAVSEKRSELVFCKRTFAIVLYMKIVTSKLLDRPRIFATKRRLGSLWERKLRTLEDGREKNATSLHDAKPEANVKSTMAII